ncbi:MAG TPA: type II toxin-antitoxin system RelE/ParE family toxin [Candidatus Eremiobacteraceae bacterium]|jgi:phage-related protein|nr:type II toxin-antitoxin system RelE/ParE family toxin [Candidatus Eremiobacteraceae bacterium]
MMQAVYYRATDGSEPARDYIDGLSVSEQVAVVNAIDRLNSLATTDPPLAFPHTSQVRGDLRELRCHYGRTLYRVLYRRSDNLFVLLHILTKRTKRIPEADMAIADARWADFKSRMNALRRRPPRAAGHDAP